MPFTSQSVKQFSCTSIGQHTGNADTGRNYKWRWLGLGMLYEVAFVCPDFRAFTLALFYKQKVLKVFLSVLIHIAELLDRIIWPVLSQSRTNFIFRYTVPTGNSFRMNRAI